MTGSICGFDCGQCPMQPTCAGCRSTQGRPFGGGCVLAECCQGRAQDSCTHCAACGLKAQLMAEFNALAIPGLPEVTELNPLRGVYVNLEYTLPNGQKARLLEDDAIYLGNLYPIGDTGRCYGITASVRYLLVCECGPDGSEAEVVLWKRRTP